MHNVHLCFADRIEIARACVNEFYSTAPTYRTKERLRKLIENAITEAISKTIVGTHKDHILSRQWVSVEESLPEAAGAYQVCLCHREVTEASYHPGAKNPWQYRISFKPLHGVTHWQPLPPPPVAHQ
jgi:Protein of unknown function (DUF551)